MDDPDDFKLIKDYYEQVSPALYRVGDLVAYSGYHYSPDYIYIDGDDYNLGIVMEVKVRHLYAPVYRIFWFKKGFATDTVQDHLRLVIINKDD
tara:strand:+ start:394 stop:672 length:279 start_codon:yes stop_codon:yes gene_type:complete